MKRTALAVRHVPFEDLGLMEPWLRARGYAVSYLDAGIDRVTPEALLGPDVLVVLGGPIGVGDVEEYPFLAAEQEAVAARLGEHRPSLGVCLGAQIMARALGATVTRSNRVEIGYGPLTLTAEGRSSVLAPLDGVPVLHWHGEQFDIPTGATRLAETEMFPNQAYVLGTSVLGLQFHLEADSTQIERWLIGHAHELASNGVHPHRIRSDARTYGPGLAIAAGQVLTNWFDEIERQ